MSARTVMSRFKDATRAHPQVTQCYHVTGDKDFILVVSMCDTAEFEGFQEQFCTQNRAIGRFSTSVLVDPVKAGLAIAVESNDGHQAQRFPR